MNADDEDVELTDWQRHIDEKTGRFLTGNKGGPGRPKGSRNKLSEQFLLDLLDAWKEFGREAIVAMIRTKPDKFVEVIARLMPKEISLKDDTDLSTYSDEQLAELLLVARRMAGIGEGDRSGHADQDGPQPAPRLPSVH